MKFVRLVSYGVLWLLCGCFSDDVPRREVLVTIDSDLVVGDATSADTQLSELSLQLYNHEATELVERREVVLSTAGGSDSSRLALPFSFSISPGPRAKSDAFRVVVTGRGPLGPGGEVIDVVERQAIATFPAQGVGRLNMFLPRTCLHELCRAGNQIGATTCDATSGECAAIPAVGVQPLDDGSVVGSGEAGVSSEGPFTSGPDGSSGSDADAGMRNDAGAEGGIGTTCDTPDALRCIESGGVARERCEAGAWVTTEPCADTEICNGSEDVEPGTCTSLFELCIGHANEAVCVGPDMHFCNEDSLSVRTETCGSERLCRAGLEAETCPLCLADTYQCDGPTLQRCGPDGNEWLDEAVCDTAELCNADSEGCTTSACLEGAKSCSGDDLLVCNAEQTAFEALETCGEGLCDPVAKQCDACVPDSRVCSANGDGVRACQGDGQAYVDLPCEGDTPYCIGEGTCVECTQSSQCGEPNPCKVASCNAGTCRSTNRVSGSCTLSGGSMGVCSGGSCVQCAGNGDCSSDRPFCVANECKPCNGPCSIGDSCSEADDCESSICTNGTCRPACSGSCALGQTCSVNADCSGSTACSNGRCVECVSDSHCASSAPYCVSNRCRECLNGNNAQCGMGEECLGQSCNTVVETCSSPADCSVNQSGTMCSNGFCLYPAPDSTCFFPPSGWSYVSYFNIEDAATHFGGNEVCLLACREGECPEGYSCRSRIDLVDPTTNTMVNVCWQDGWQ